MLARVPRWVLLAAFWVFQAAALYCLWPVLFGGHPGYLSDYLRWLAERDYVPYAVPTVVAVTLAQAALLWPVRRPARSADGRSLMVSMIAAGLVVSLLLVGMILIGLDLLWYFNDVAGSQSPLSGTMYRFPLTLQFFGMVGLGWAAATPLLIAFSRPTMRETFIGRLSAKLLLGTIIEVAAGIPVSIMVRKRDSCYCDHGSFWALTICTAVGTVVLGPAIFMPVLARRRKRWYAGHCEVCGYDMSGCAASPRCPECGAGWRAGKPGAAVTDSPPRTS